MQNYVFVVDTNRKPLDPITPKKARRLLDKGKAAVLRMYPFTIILKTAVIRPRLTPCQIKIDPGSKTTGFALVRNGGVIWGMELEHRGHQISEKLTKRRVIRRGRRNKLRYRKPRFLNRKRHSGWLAPSLEHRVATVETWVLRLIKFVPVSEIWIEKVKFDLQKMQDPEISGTQYQQGTLQGYEVREYLLHKWGRECTYCSKKNVPLQIEHIKPKSKGGSNRVSNLCLACEKCNQRKGNKSIEDFLCNKPSLLKKIKSQAKKALKDAAAVNATRNAIVDTISSLYWLKVATATGAQTKYNRTRLNFRKEHWIDAACVGDVESLVLKTTQPLRVTCKGHGGRQKAVLNKYGYPVQHRPLKPIKGWCSGDIAKNVQDNSFGVVTPRTKGNSFEFRVKGRKPKSLHVKNLLKVHTKDGYAYSFFLEITGFSASYR